jgi:hypothetical protein
MDGFVWELKQMAKVWDSENPEVVNIGFSDLNGKTQKQTFDTF